MLRELCYTDYQYALKTIFTTEKRQYLVFKVIPDNRRFIHCFPISGSVERHLQLCFEQRVDNKQLSNPFLPLLQYFSYELEPSFSCRRSNYS